MAKEEQKSYWAKYYRENRKEILEKRKKAWAIYYASHKSEILTKSNRKKWIVKNEVLAYYGNGKCMCVKCGFSDIRALTIDHLLGGGRKERMKLGNGCDRGGIGFYRWLRKNGYPGGYQTLCMNCQLIKQVTTPIDL